MPDLPNPVIKRCEKCGQAMFIRQEDVTLGDGTLTQYTYWTCPCGHEVETGKTYLERHGEI